MIINGFAFIQRIKLLVRRQCSYQERKEGKVTRGDEKGATWLPQKECYK